MTRNLGRSQRWVPIARNAQRLADNNDHDDGSLRKVLAGPCSTRVAKSGNSIIVRQTSPMFAQDEVRMSVENAIGGGAMAVAAPMKTLTPLDKMRQAFPDAAGKSNGWFANPDNPKFDFREEEDGHIHINPWTGDTAEEVLAQGKPPLRIADLYPQNGTYVPVYREKQLDLLSLAEYLKLDWRFLMQLGYSDGYTYMNKSGKKTRCVKLGGYCTPDGKPHSKNKVRLSIDGKTRFLWDQNTPGTPIPCGLHRLGEARAQGFLVIGEGESDAATMWFHGFPYLGISGADAAKHLDVSLLHDIPRVYLIEEPDQAKKNTEHGQGFYASMRAHLRNSGYTGEIFSIRFADATGYKDPSQLHKELWATCDITDELPRLSSIKAAFAEAFRRAIEQAIPEGNDGLEHQEDPEPPPAMPDNDGGRWQWFSQLCALPAYVLSPSCKITLAVIIMHGWHDETQPWYTVDADDLAAKAGMTKRVFLANLAYLTDKVQLFIKNHRLIQYEAADGKTLYRTELSIQPSPKAWLAYPSTYRLKEGEPERKQTRKSTPAPVTEEQALPPCEDCESTNVVAYGSLCLDCNHVTYPPVESEPSIESTATILPIQEDVPTTQIGILEEESIGYSNRYSEAGTTKSTFPSNWTPGEPCTTCGCPLAIHTQCVRCYPPRGYLHYKEAVNQLYPKRAKVLQFSPPEIRVNHAYLDGGLWKVNV